MGNSNIARTLRPETPQGNHILIFEPILIYQHFHPEPLTHHREPVEGLHPLLLILSPLPLILSLSKDGLSTLLLDNSTSPSQSPLICFSRWKASCLVENWSLNTKSTGGRDRV